MPLDEAAVVPLRASLRRPAASPSAGSSAGGIRELHRRASRWHEESQLPDEAVAHATAAEDWDRAADIIESIGQRRTVRGEWATIRDWLRVLPDSVLRTHSALACGAAWRFAVTGPSEDARPE